MALRPTNRATKTQSLQFTHMNNLSPGSKILFATDDWFAEAENLLKSTDPEWKEGVFTPEGKWMDGWETRRKRIPGHDFCIIKLAYPSVIFGVECNTSFFTGNFTPCVSIQAGCLSESDEALIPARKGVRGQGASKEDLKRVSRIQSEKWTTLVGKTRLGAGYSDTCHNYMDVASRELWTHIRLNYYPDGGVARLRIFGRVQRSLSNIITAPAELSIDNCINLVAMKTGGYCIGLSDAHYGHPRNLILDGKTRNIGDGWETARKLERPNALTVDDNGNLELYGFEWAAFRLGIPGTVRRIDVDTTAFKGNAPYACKIEGRVLKNYSTNQRIESDYDNQLGKEEDENKMACMGAGFQQSSKSPWVTLLNTTPLNPDTNHEFGANQLERGGVLTHVRVTIYPDGGLAKLRVWGVPLSETCC